jgi:hypothetical protein
MRPLSASELLDVWEAGQDQLPVGRALALLAAACPDAPPAQLAAMTVGRRDAAILTLREWTFGSQVSGLAICDACDERLDLSFQVDEILAEMPVGEEPGSHSEVVVLEADYQVSCRLPTSADLVAVRHADGPAARLSLLERCLLSASERGETRTAAELPPAVVAAVAQAMSDADPAADMELALTCPGCGHAWSSLFDVVGFFWSEISTWAVRTLHEVHLLASAYGWPERDILALSPRRRRAYLELVQA